MIGASVRPSGRLPCCKAVMICSTVQSPIPVSLSGVMFRPGKAPRPGISNATSEPPKYFVMSGRLAQGKWNTGFFDDTNGSMIHSFDCKARITKIRFNPEGSKMFLAGGVGQPKLSKDLKYDPFDRIILYNIA